MSKEELEQENIELRQKIAELQDLLEQCKVLLESLDLKKKKPTLQYIKSEVLSDWSRDWEIKRLYIFKDVETNRYKVMFGNWYGIVPICETDTLEDAEKFCEEQKITFK